MIAKLVLMKTKIKIWKKDDNLNFSEYNGNNNKNSFVNNINNFEINENIRMNGNENIIFNIENNEFK